MEQNPIEEARIEKIANGYVVYFGSPMHEKRHFPAISNALDAIKVAFKGKETVFAKK